MKLRAVAVEVEEDDVRGINTKSQLAEAEAVAQQRLRRAALDAGVTLVAPETVFLSADTIFGKDVVVEPYVIFGEKVTVEDGAVIHAFSHLAGAHIGKAASIGPFARLRPGTRIGERARVGNFVEVKEASIEAGAKANHLSYIGDAVVGANANIGAGTITCNYDGAEKYRTDIGSERSSAPIRRWWRRWRSATAPMSAPVRSSPKNVPPDALRWGVPARSLRKTARRGCAISSRSAKRSPIPESDAADSACLPRIQAWGGLNGIPDETFFYLACRA